MNKVQPRFEVDNRLSLDAEPEVTWLDDSRVNTANRDFVYAFAFNSTERVGSTVVGEFIRRTRLFQKGRIICRPKLIQRQRSQVWMIERRHFEQIEDLALKTAGQVRARS